MRVNVINFIWEVFIKPGMSIFSTFCKIDKFVVRLWEKIESEYCNKTQYLNNLASDQVFFP